MSPHKQQSLEEYLRRIAPQAVNPELRMRIEHNLQQTLKRRRMARIRRLTVYLGVGFAACLLLSLGSFLWLGSSPVGEDALQVAGPTPLEASISELPESTEGTFQTVLTENNLRNRIDEGIVFLANGLSARQYRYQFLDRVVWKNPANGAVVELEVPRDEVVLVPVQTF